VKEKNKNKPKKTKTLKLNPDISQHDVSYRVVNSKKWLDKGNRVRIEMRFKGREITFKEAGLAIFNELVKELKDYGAVENSPLKEEDNTFSIILDSKKKTS